MLARCECGAARARGAEACVRCAWLDGLTEAEAKVISAVRVLGGRSTPDALALETGYSERSLRRVIANLRRLGRIVVERERDEQNQDRATYVLSA